MLAFLAQFNLQAALCIATTTILYLKSPSMLLAFIFATTIFNTIYMEAMPGYIKFLAATVFGLGSLVLGRNLQSKAFTIYVNFAVLGNILMMVLVPAEGTLRAWPCKACCLLLSYWLYLQLKSANYSSVTYKANIFLYHCSNMPWIYSHAAYRFILMTLPRFQTRKYFMMEVYSLGLTRILHFLYGSKDEKPEWYFGIADTLVVSSLTITTPFYDFVHGNSASKIPLSLPMDISLAVFGSCLALIIGLQIYRFPHKTIRKN
jgi:Ca2+/Na+ antiporter